METDKEKLLALAKTIREIQIPKLETIRGGQTVQEIEFRIQMLTNWLAEQADEL